MTPLQHFCVSNNTKSGTVFKTSEMRTSKCQLLSILAPEYAFKENICVSKLHHACLTKTCCHIGNAASKSRIKSHLLPNITLSAAARLNQTSYLNRGRQRHTQLRQAQAYRHVLGWPAFCRGPTPQYHGSREEEVPPPEECCPWEMALLPPWTLGTM